MVAKKKAAKKKAANNKTTGKSTASAIAKRAVFAREYLKDLNGTQAAIRAGYAPGAAATEAWRLLRFADVQAIIQKGRDRLVAKAEYSAESVQAELVKMGFANMQDYMTVGADGLPRLDWSGPTRDQACALSEVTVDVLSVGKGDDPDCEEGEGPSIMVQRVKFKLADKLAALDKMIRMLGLYKDKVELSGNPDSPLHAIVERVSNQPLIPSEQLKRQG